MEINTWTAFILGCWFGGGWVGAVICWVYRDELFPPEE